MLNHDLKLATPVVILLDEWGGFLDTDLSLDLD